MSQAERKPILSRNVRLLGWASLLNDIGSEMTFPLMPLFLTRVLGGTALDLGIIEGLADTTASFLKLGSGGWSDRFGSRKWFVVIGYAFTALVRPLAGLAMLPWHLVAVRFSDRVGKGLRATPRDALVADSTDPKYLGWAFGYTRAMDHLGAAIGPLLAFMMLRWWFPADPEALRWLFGLTLVPGLMLIALVYFGLEDTRPTKQTKNDFTLSLAPFDGNYRLFLLAMFTFALGNSTDAFLLKQASDLGVAEAYLPLLWLALHLIKSSGSLLAGASANRLGAKRLIFIGWLIYGLVYTGFAFATSAWHAWALFLLYGLFYALTEPVEKKLVADLVPSDRRGLAYGWYHFAMGIAALPASLIFGFCYDRFGAPTAFGFGAGMALAAAVLLAGVKSGPATSAVAAGVK